MGGKTKIILNRRDLINNCQSVWIIKIVLLIFFAFIVYNVLLNDTIRFLFKKDVMAKLRKYIQR